METLIQRLVANPHDEEALAYAHRAGTQDPRAYAVLLEKVGQATQDPSYAAHWLSEAANVWSTTIGDAHHAARTLMGAIEKDPTARSAAERLAQLYRDKGDQRALIALQERLVKSLSGMLSPDRPEVREQLIALHEDLGKLWGDPPLSRPDRAVENWRRVVELDQKNAYAIYAARELYKAQQQFAEAVPYFALEQALVEEPDRKLALYRDEADIRRRAGDLPGATQALRGARKIKPDDIPLKQEVGASILERLEAGEEIGEVDRKECADLFVSLAETYDGEYGLSYSVSALKAMPGNDRAMQLADYYGSKLNRVADLGPRYAAYLQANPSGFMANEARAKVGNAVPPPKPSAPALAPPPQQQPSRPSQPAAQSPLHGGGGGMGGPQPSASQQFQALGAAAPQPAMQGPQPSASQQIQAIAPEPSPPQTGAQPPAFAQAPQTGAQQPAFAQAPQTGAQQPAFAQAPQTGAQAPQAAAPAPSAPSAGSAADLPRLLEEASGEAQKGRKPQALAKYRDALKIDPANSEALSWVEEHLRQKRMYADLRDVLLAASRAPNVSADTRKAQLRDVAGICESQLRDIETAIQAWKQVCQIDRGDEQARDQLRRLLEKGARWDDLALMLEQEAMGTPDVEQKIAIEKKLAQLHEGKRKDPAAAAEAWARIASYTPEDDTAIHTAVKLYEKAERFDLAAQVISDAVGGIEDKNAKGPLLQKLGDLRAKAEDHSGAGDAYAEAADALGQAKVWELAEKSYVTANRLDAAANAIDRRAELTDGKPKAALLAQAADLFARANDSSSAIAKLEQATELDPLNDAYADALAAHYQRDGREPDLVMFLLGRADKIPDKQKRVTARRTAAQIQTTIGDREGARESLLLVLNDGDDEAALHQLVEDAVERGEHQEAVDFLRRLGAVSRDPQAKLTIALREASILADEINDGDGAIERYEAILKELDPKNRFALHAIADLHEKKSNLPGAAAALEREITLAEGEERVDLAQRLAQLYEGPLADPRGAIRALSIVNAADPEDFDAIARLQRLCEEVEDWPRVVTLMQQLIEVEGDEEEASRLTIRLAEILSEKQNRGDEALSALEKLADQGDGPCRDAYVALGDKLGWKGIVATKLVAWNESGSGPERNDALKQAFYRFLEIGRDADAARVAMEVARSRGADRPLVEKLEEIAARIKDLDALSVAHDLLMRDLSGPARATELVRQAEMQVRAGVDPLEAIQHGEGALNSVPAAEVDPLLARLAALAPSPANVIDLYERQVSRCRAPADRLAALARAAQVAAERGVNDRARGFFELALGGGVQEDTINALEGAARLGDERSGSTALRAILAEALAGGGQGSRDGGRTRGSLLRRAATIAQRDLNDVGRAFGWLGDALVTHVEDASLDAIEALGRDLNDMKRVEATITRALEEVFDGPLVRKLLQRRARLRRDVLADLKGAAVDLKKLHDLSPADQEVMNELSALLTDLGDHRGMIQLYEDQILRGRDPNLRAELARKVARIWEEEIADAREAADAWRRVLRMKAGDADATAGLERAKAGKLKKAPPKPPPQENKPAPQPAAPPPAAAAPAPPKEPTPAPAPVIVPAQREEIPPPDMRGAMITAPDADIETTSDEAPVGLPPLEPTPQPPAAQEQAYEPAPQQQAYDPAAQQQAYDPAAQQQAYDPAAQQYPQGYDPNAYAQQYPQGYDPNAYAQQYPQGYDPNAYAQHYQQQGYDPNAPQHGYDPNAPQQGYDPNAPQQGYDPNAYAQQGYAYPQGYDAAAYAQYYAQQAAAAQAAQAAQVAAPAEPKADGEEVAEVDDAELLEDEGEKKS